MLPLHQRRVLFQRKPDHRFAAVPTRTHKSRSRPPVFKTGPSSSRMTSVLQAAGVGIEPTASWFRRSPTTALSLHPRSSLGGFGCSTNSNDPAMFVESKHSVRELHPTCELQRLTPRLRTGESALRESNPPRQVGSLEPLPLGQEHKLSAEGEGTNPGCA